MVAIVFMATMMTISASFASMAETAVEIVSNENSDSSSDGSFETTDKTVDENDNVIFDEEEKPEVEKEHAEEDETTVSSDTVVEVTGKDDVSVTVDEIVIEKNNNDIIVSSDSEINTEKPEDTSSLITGKESELENDIQFETTSKVVEDVEVVEFDEEPVKNEVIATPEVSEEDIPTDLPPEVVKPDVPVTPEPEKPQPEVPGIPKTEKPHVDHNDHDDNDNHEVTIYSKPPPVFKDEPSPRLTQIPVFVDEPTPSALPKTGDSAPLSGYVFAFTLVALVAACLSGCQFQKASKAESGLKLYLYNPTKLCSVFGKLLIYFIFSFIVHYVSRIYDKSENMYAISDFYDTP